MFADLLKSVFNMCRFHMSGEHGALTCSHLQSYDPDRALTDYISRLEALQRRLGSVTSGNSSSGYVTTRDHVTAFSITSNSLINKIIGKIAFSCTRVVFA